MIKTIAQIVPLIEFKFTLCKVASNVANSFEVLTTKFGGHVREAICCSTRHLFCVNKHVFNMFSKVRETGLKDKIQHVSLCSDWLFDDRCWTCLPPHILLLLLSAQLCADSWGGLCCREAELRIWMVSSDSGHISIHTCTPTWLFSWEVDLLFF